MRSATPDEFRTQHARTITRLYTLGRGRRWGLAESDFGLALFRSQSAHFRASSTVGRREIDRYLQSLDLADLALVTACRRDIPHAWQSLHADYLPVLHEAARASLREPEAAHRTAEKLFSELHGPNGEILEQYHGRSRLKTWLRALVVRVHDGEIRSPGRIPVEDSVAEPWFFALGETLAALEPADRLRLALYALERLPMASIGTLLGETKVYTARRLRVTGRNLRTDVVKRLSREARLDRREIRRLEREATDALPGDDPRTALEAFVAIALVRRLNAPGRQCPPPATLASFVEGRLGEAERQSAMLHTSACHGCVRQVGVLCRLERPGLAAESLELGRGSRERTLVLATLLVGLVAAGALVVLRPPTVDPVLQGVRGLWSGGSSVEIPAAPDVSTAPRAAQPPKDLVDAARTTKPAGALRKPEVPPETAQGPESAMERSGVSEAPTSTIPTSAVDALPASTPPSSISPPGTAAPSPRAVATETETPVPPSPTATTRPSETPTVAPTSTLAPTSAPTVRPTRRPPPTPRPPATRPLPPTARPTALPALHPADQPGVTNIVLAPGDRNTRWWIAARGAIAHTRDGARTWNAVPSGVTSDLVAGSAASASVAWIVGRGGTILRTTNGTSFVRVASPTRDDVVSVTANDARRATITTAAGARFATEDGGTTWRRR